MSDGRYPKSVLTTLLEADINNKANIGKYNWISLVKKAFFRSIDQIMYFDNFEIIVDLQTYRLTYLQRSERM